MEIIKITKDKERIKSIFEMVDLIEKRIKADNKNQFLPLILSDYYAVIKELMTAILICDGYKILSHKDLIEYLEKNYRIFNKSEIISIDNLRMIRNRIVYEGFKVSPDILINHESIFLRVIEKLKVLIRGKI